MEASVTVVLTLRRAAASLAYLVRPLLADPATLEVVVVGDRARGGTADPLDARPRREAPAPPVEDVRVRRLQARAGVAARQLGAEEARGELLLFLDDDVLARRGLVSGHLERHAAGGRRVVAGYTPVRLLEGRTGADFAAHLYWREYERRCELLERDPAGALEPVNFSMRRDDCLAIGIGDVALVDRYRPDRGLAEKLSGAGFELVFDRSLVALRLHRQSLAEFVADARGGRAGIGRPPWRRGVEAAASLALCGVVTTAGSARMWRLQERSAMLLREVERRRSAPPD
jgi:hypothetical protein